MRLLAVSLMLLTMFVGGCALSGEPAPSSEQDAVRDAERVAYTLGPGDQLRILVFGEADLSGDFVVSPQGLIAYPLVGDLNASGLTVEGLSGLLFTRLSPDYVRQPKISIDVLNYRPFYILGEVNKPGTYSFSTDLTVMAAVATAGGFSYRADSKRVYIRHVGASGETEYRLTSVTPVRPGDTVRIAERRF